MDLVEQALKFANGDEEDREIAVVYAQLAIAGQLGSIVIQLERIDDALRNTTGGTPR